MVVFVQPGCVASQVVRSTKSKWCSTGLRVLFLLSGGHDRTTNRVGVRFSSCRMRPPPLTILDLGVVFYFEEFMEYVCT